MNNIKTVLEHLTIHKSQKSMNILNYYLNVICTNTKSNMSVLLTQNYILCQQHSSSTWRENFSQCVTSATLYCFNSENIYCTKELILRQQIVFTALKKVYKPSKYLPTNKASFRIWPQILVHHIIKCFLELVWGCGMKTYLIGCLKTFIVSLYFMSKLNIQKLTLYKHNQSSIV